MQNKHNLTDVDLSLSSTSTVDENSQPEEAFVVLEDTVNNLADASITRQDHSKPFRIFIRGDLANDTGANT